MRLRYNYRVYPTPSQQASLARAFGCARVVFNDGLRARQEAREQGLPYLSDAELSKRVTAAKATPERRWLSEVSSVVLQQALADLNVAYRNFFASISGKRKGRKVAPPRFRSRKDNRQAIRFTANARFKVLDNGRLRLPKIGDVEVRWSRGLPSEPSSVTVIRDAAGRYFVSFVVQTTQDETLPPAGSEVRHVGVQGRPVRAHLCPGGSVLPVHPDVLGLRPDQRQDGAHRPSVGLPVRQHPRPGRQRGHERARGGTRREPKRLWSAGKTGIRAGTAPGSRNPPGRRVFHAQRGGNLRLSGRRNRQGCRRASVRTNGASRTTTVAAISVLGS
ncbi:transposase [Micromonospora sp. DPT]|uniref:RNA-guided endonuclease InsQ/TnpB family protein n=1 Tax=Micromonospora sp. DPT TaxID=3142975 RepID=UPI0032085441